MLKIQFLNGGLANQAFQYIFARHYELSHPGETMYLDDSYFAINTVHNGYELEKVFGIKPHMLSEAFDADVWEYMLEQKRNGKSIPQLLWDNGTRLTMISDSARSYQRFNPFDGETYLVNAEEYMPEAQDFVGNVYYHGYWLHKGWFKRYEPQLLKEFKFPPLTDAYNKSIMHRILNEKSVAIHIRRGDYVTLDCAYDVGKYQEMIEKFLKRYEGGEEGTLFVFSDDVAWCKENSGAMQLNRFKECIFVEGNSNGRNYIDLQLMSHCKYMLIGNSAFAFLAALLNQNRLGGMNASARDV